MTLFEFAWLAALAACGAVAVAGFANARPRLALVVSYFALIAAGIKFRLRDATATLSESLDWQIALELTLFGCIALIVVLGVLSRHTAWRRLVRLELLLVAFVALALLSTVWSSTPSLTLVRACQMIVICGLALASVRILGPTGTLRSVSAALITYVLVCASIALPTGMSYYAEGYYRLTWFQVHPIAAGISAAQAALAVLAWALFANHHQRLQVQRVFFRSISWIVFLVLCLVLILTNSRGPLLAFILTTGLLLWKAMRPGVLRAFLVAAVMFMVILQLLAGDSLGRSLEHGKRENNMVVQRLLRGGNVESLRDLNGRLELWQAALPLILDRPFFGYGYNGSRPFLYARVSWGSYAHSAYVQTLLDFGVAGVVVLWGLLGCALAVLISRPLGAVTGSAWCDAALTAFAAFTVLISITSESFVATPGFDTLIVFVAIAIVAQYLHGAPRLSLTNVSRSSYIAPQRDLSARRHSARVRTPASCDPTARRLTPPRGAMSVRIR
jgi:exopolysaccharide production protein ExoQ